MILVTGATGLVGGHLLWHLLQENDTVTAICRKSSNTNTLRIIFSFYTDEPDSFLSRINWKIADVIDKNSLHEAFQGISQVYHCAGVVSLGGNADILSETNVSGTRNMVEMAIEKRINKFCFVSSISACGSKDGYDLIDENDVWTDCPSRSLYSKSKYYSEQEVWKGIEKGLNAVIVNPGVILGVSGNNAGSAELFYRVRKGLVFYTNGGSAYVDVQDVAKCMIGLMRSDVCGGRFILSADNYSNKDILSWIADGFGKRRPFIPVGRTVLMTIGFLMEVFGKLFRFRPIIDRGTARTAINRKFYSNEKIVNTLGYKFLSMKKSIHHICTFYKRTMH